MKKKIMFIIWALDVGGAERLLVKLVQNIPSDLYDVRVICMSWKGVWAKELEESGIQVISMDKKVGLDLGILFRLTALIKREQPDIVNTHLWTADLWGRLAAILAGVKHIIVTEQNVDVWKRWYHIIIDRILFRWTKYVICVSNEVVEFYNKELKIPLSKIKMIPNAIDLSLFDNSKTHSGLRDSLGIRKTDFIFVCAARLHPQKAHHILINAVEKLVDEGYKGFKVLLVGEGELRNDLEDLVKSKNLSKWIFFLGLRQDIPEIFLQSDAFVLSSDYEGLPLAILEAMAAKLPIIATRVGGNPQVIEDSKNGFLVPSQDSDALASAMKKVLTDKSMAQKMGNEGRKLIEQTYSIKIIAKKTIELFEHCLYVN